MPKMKTHKSTSKRFKVTANGKILHYGANRGHLNQKKSSRRKSRLGKMLEVSTANLEKLSLLVPYPKYLR